MSKLLAGVFLVLTLSACAGRAPVIPPVFLASDTDLDCDAIQTEARINNQKLSALATERGWKMGQNAVAGIAGFMIWPAWLGLDLQDAAGKEAQALSQRNEYLATLAVNRCKPTSQTASLPAFPDISSAFAPNAQISTSLVTEH